MNLNKALYDWIADTSATVSSLSLLLIQKGIMTEEEFSEMKKKMGDHLELLTKIMSTANKMEPTSSDPNVS